VDARSVPAEKKIAILSGNDDCLMLDP